MMYPNGSRAEHVAAALDAAADNIETRGWTQGEYRDLAGRVCALGALGTLGRSVSAEVLTEAVCTLRSYVGGPVAGWNDTEGRTATEVIDALRGAAKDALRAEQEKTW